LPGFDKNAVKGVPMPYARFIGSAQFERSASYEQNGYRVESGMLSEKGKEVGALVTVRSSEGAILALVSKTGDAAKTGVWHVTPLGVSRFEKTPAAGPIGTDYVEGTLAPDTPKAKPDASGVFTIDVLMGFSKASAVWAQDPVAQALAHVEAVNLSLRNTQIATAKLSLAGVQILNENLAVHSAVLARMHIVFEQGRTDSGADLVAGLADEMGSAAGKAYVPGNTSVNWVNAPAILAHEVAHNVGGSHCNDGSEEQKDNYKFGYDNGKSPSSLCNGGWELGAHYSNPDQRDEYGLPRGNARIGDMARTWRENAAVMAGYVPSLPGERLILASINGSASAVVTLPTLAADKWAGVVVDDASEGPRTLQYGLSGYARLVTLLKDKFGHEHSVVLRGERLTGCSSSPMNAADGCGDGQAAIQLRISLVEADNPRLVGGMLTGKVKLKMLDLGHATFSKDVTALISVRRPPARSGMLDNTANAADVSTVIGLPMIDGDKNSRAVVALDQSEGPTVLTTFAGEGYTVLKVLAADQEGELHEVRLRASRAVRDCKAGPMNNSTFCINAGDIVNLTVSYVRADNPTLAANTYHGNIQLAVKKIGSSAAQPIELRFNIKK
jgi:hypothetical protein